MPKIVKIDEIDETLTDHKFSKGVRGKYYAGFIRGTNVVLLDRDVAELFPNYESLNRALRTMV